MYRMPFTDRLLYASGSLGSQAVLQALLLWAVFFYAPPGNTGRDALLPLSLVGGLVFAGRMVDVVTDPAVGVWSDRTRTRWGRRIPFMALGTPLMVVTFVIIWTPPAALSQPLLSGYLFLVLGLFFLGHTLSGRPYDALLPEISSDSRERVNISALRVVLGLIGAALGLVASGLLIERAGFVVMGILLGLVALLTRYAAIAGVWRWTARHTLPSQTSVLEGFALVARNRPFRFYLPSFILFSMAVSILTQLLPFHVRAVLQREEATVSVLTGVSIGVVMLSLPALSWLAARKGKRWIYSRAMLATTVVLPALGVAGFLPGAPPLLQVAVVVGLLGACMSAALLFPPALMADIIDHDEERTGERREAIYYGMEQGTQKIGIALSTVILTVVLETFGFTAEDPLGIRLIGPIAAGLTLVGFLIFVWGYRLDPRPAPQQAGDRATAG